MSTVEGTALAKKLGAAFVESSAKDNKNVGKLGAVSAGTDIELTHSGKAFEVLLGEMQKEYNPAPEKKKAGWFSWGK